MKIVMTPEGVLYNRVLTEALQTRGVDIELYGKWLLYLPDHVDEILALNPDIISLQWPESIAGIHSERDTETVLRDFAQCLPALKKNGAKLILTMHNILPHVRAQLDRWEKLYQLFATHVDAVSHHSQWGMDFARATYTFSAKHHFLLRHGYFAEENICTLSKAEAREALGVDQDAAVFFSMGGFGKYKKNLELVELFKNRSEVLLMAGPPFASDPAYGEAVIAAAEGVPNVQLLCAWVEAEELSLRARASDAFLFTYGENHLTSGSPHLSQAHELPQITLDTEYNREVLGDSAIYIPCASDHTAELNRILDTLDLDTLEQKRQLLLQTRSDWAWPLIAEQTEQAYREMLA